MFSLWMLKYQTNCSATLFNFYWYFLNPLDGLFCQASSLFKVHYWKLKKIDDNSQYCILPLWKTIFERGFFYFFIIFRYGFFFKAKHLLSLFESQHRQALMGNRCPLPFKPHQQRWELVFASTWNWMPLHQLWITEMSLENPCSCHTVTCDQLWTEGYISC